MDKKRKISCVGENTQVTSAIETTDMEEGGSGFVFRPILCEMCANDGWP